LKIAFQFAILTRKLDEIIFKGNPAEIAINVGKSNNDNLQYGYFLLPSGEEFYLINTGFEEPLEENVQSKNNLSLEDLIQMVAYTVRIRVQKRLGIKLLSPEDFRKANIPIVLFNKKPVHPTEINKELFDAVMVGSYAWDIWRKTKSISAVAKFVGSDAEGIIKSIMK
jgi:exonuclease V gamma subunit